jgi:peroxiredoxin
MKKLFFTLTLCLSLNQIQAQNTVNFTGQIKNTNPEELIYLGLEGSLLPLKIMEDGTFSVDQDIEQSPSFFYFAKISKRGKIERQTPQIWFENKRIVVSVNWADKSFQMGNLMTFQPTSERIEASKSNDQIDLILKNPNEMPSLYFADKLKEKFSSSELEKYYKSLNNENKNSIYAKRIENYLLAIKREPLKKGSTVENFKLPNKNGEHINVVNVDNKPQVIALFSSGCAYSITSIKLLEQLTELNNNKIEIVSIWDDQSRDTWLNSYQDEKSKITWTNLWDEYGFAKTYLDRTMWPTFYVINEKGDLAQILKGYDKKTARELKKLVK